MASKSDIQWTDATWNPHMGCKKVSDGCKYCYMHRILDKDGKDASVIWRTGASTFNSPLSWTNPRRIFTCSMSDFFIEEADSWRKDIWDIIRKTPHHTYQILTKRPERIVQCLPPDWGSGWKNVWLGVSVESNKYFERVDMLSKIPAYVRFISAEPLLDNLDLLQSVNGKRPIDAFHWAIIGGESGYEYGKYRYRNCEQQWIERIIHDLKTKTAVRIFHKQLGTGLAKKLGCKDPHGGNIAEWPEHLRIRQFPFRPKQPAIQNLIPEIIL